MIDVKLETMSREVLETAVRLRDPLKHVYLALVTHGKSATSTEIADLLSLARAYVAMRLNQLVDMGLAKRSHAGRKVQFEAAF